MHVHDDVDYTHADTVAMQSMTTQTQIRYSQ